MNNIKFKELNLSEPIQKAIDSMGFEEATPIQSSAIPSIMEGKDVTGLAQTGTGKTFAFGIPAIEKLNVEDNCVQVLILCPTRELAIQTCEGIKQLTKFLKKVKVVPIYGGQSIERQITSLKKGAHIVVGTPGRVMDHMKRKTLKLDNTSMFILDEADEMLSMGFREDIDNILGRFSKDRQVILFSATMSKAIKDITAKYQSKDAVTVEVAHVELVAPKIDQYYLEVTEKNKPIVLTGLLDSMDLKLAVVFCNTKRKVEDITLHLQASGYTAEGLHGDIRQSQRDNIMKKFRSGKLDILVATDVAARGIDIDDIDVVFNYDIPNDEEYYVHRIGRTGRAGRTGVAYTFVSGREIYKIKEIQRYTKSNIKLKKTPTFNDLIDKKVEQELDKVKDIYEKNNFNKYVDIVTKFLENEENITAVDISAIFLKEIIEKGVKGITENIDTREDSNKGNKRSGKNKNRSEHKLNKEDIDNINKKNITFFMNVGKMDEVNGKIIRELLTREYNIPTKSITNIKVLDKFSFVDILKESAFNIVKNKQIKTYKNIKLNFEISNKNK